MNLLKDLQERQLVRPPHFLADGMQYLTVMGSTAYGVAEDTSDWDVYGMCVPPKQMVFPHLAGDIEGFGRQKKRFTTWQQHHVFDKQAQGGQGRNYDFQIYNIVQYFHLCMQCNPNMIDSLFTPIECVLFQTQVGVHMRERRRLFLHKGAWHSFKGYSYAQLHKMKNRSREEVYGLMDVYHVDHDIAVEDIEAEREARHETEYDGRGRTLGHLDNQQLSKLESAIKGLKELPEGNRRVSIEQHGYDVKFGYHVVRLLNEVEQIMTEGDLDLQRNREQLKSIRRGEWTEAQIRAYFDRKESELETLYNKSTLPWGPDQDRIKEVLLECLEMCYGSLDACVVRVGAAEQAISKIEQVVQEFMASQQVPAVEKGKGTENA